MGFCTGACRDGACPHACGLSNRPVSEGPEVPMHPSDSPADRRDQETRAPAETPPSPGAVGQGKPRIYLRDGQLMMTWMGFTGREPSEADKDAFIDWARGINIRATVGGFGWRSWR